jgi:mannose/fructose/N-acetylgalactosamine-specific phosphotransferase system component IIB
MTLVLSRIDDRLVHGQVVVGWAQPLDVSFVVLVDDMVAATEWERELYRMGVPPDMELYIHDVAEARAAIPRYQADPRNGILLTGDTATMGALVSDGLVRAVNVGGIHHRAGRTPRLRYVFLTPQEEADLRAMQAAGATVTAQDVPGARPMPLDELLSQEGT